MSYQFAERFSSLVFGQCRQVCWGLLLCGAISALLAGCSGQPELISPAAKADTKKENDNPAEISPAKEPAELPGSSTADEKAIAAETQPADTGVKPVTHVVDVAMPTIANRSVLDGPARIAPVLLSAAEQKLCKLNVGGKIPAIALPNLAGEATNFTDLAGEKLTVVVFWNPLDPYSTWELADLSGDVLEPYQSLGVEVVGICAGTEALPVEAAAAQSNFEKTAAKFPCLIDAQGEVMNQFGSDRTSRTYLLDAEGKILWFDIEYSRSTRRELKSALAFLLDKPAKAKPAGK